MKKKTFIWSQSSLGVGLKKNFSKSYLFWFTQLRSYRGIELIQSLCYKSSHFVTKAVISEQKQWFQHKSSHFSTKAVISAQQQSFQHKISDFSNRAVIWSQYLQHIRLKEFFESISHYVTKAVILAQKQSFQSNSSHFSTKAVAIEQLFGHNISTTSD